MANKWAIQNGNWSDGSTWNDGVVPTADDDVWLNNHIVDLANGAVINVKSISNGSVGTISAGGYLIGPNAVGNYAINADIYIESGFLLYRFWGNINDDANAVNIVGNVYSSTNCYLMRIDSYSYGWIKIVGNVIGSLYSCGFSQARIHCYITGNVNSNGNPILYSDVINSGGVTVYSQIGNLTLDSMISYQLKYTTGDNIIINGNVKLVDEGTLNCTTASGEAYSVLINGILDVSESTNVYVFSTSNMSLKTTSGLSVVAKPSYDIPQSVVLEGYEYGDKVGTLKTVQGTIIEQATVIEDATVVEEASVVNLTEQQLQRVGNCATVSTVQKCFEDFKE